ncbi:MAG: C4-dicarboxylate ABC transporter permease [Clostridiaceae bacterium BRH_c20a]|nr:MAG: C4-dicarboxylate ABC transporter permease [Clostridiaceae bacterium BRH_c20a]
MTTIVGLGLIGLMFLSVPIGIAIGLASMLGILLSGIPLQVAAQRMVVGLTHFTLLALPFFIFAGTLMEHGGISKRLIRMVSAFVGHRTGGIAIVTVISAMIFSSLSGSGSATTAALGSILIPAMIAKNYSRGFAASVQAVSGELGIIIPPSITFILFGVATETSIGDLFIAGVIPGILIGCSLVAISYVLAKKKGYTGVEKMEWKERGVAFKEAFWALLMPVIILGGIYTGIFTPTEAAVVAVAYSFIVGFFIYKEITWEGFKKAVNEALITSGMIMFIIANASIFSWLLTRESVPQNLAILFGEISSSPIMFLLIINAFLLIVGMFFDAAPVVIVLAGILTPIAESFGINPVHFGVIMAVNLAFGMVTPPVGVNLFVACRLANIGMEQMIRDLIPYWIVLLVNLLIITYLPQLSLWLPSLLK